MPRIECMSLICTMVSRRRTLLVTATEVMLLLLQEEQLELEQMLVLLLRRKIPEKVQFYTKCEAIIATFLSLSYPALFHFQNNVHMFISGQWWKS